MTPETYIFKKMHSVQGYIDPLDALAFTQLLQDQSNAGHDGALFEIGVYYGRSLMLLDILRQPGEALLGADLFLTDVDRFGAGHQKKTLLSRAAALERNIDETNLLEGDSTKLTPDAIQERIGKARFVHVDGGHLTKHVLSDAKLATDLLSDQGIICFDDFFNTRWPDVTTACLQYLQDQNALVPFLITDKKLYVCPSAHAARYRSSLKASSKLARFYQHDRALLEDDVITIGHPAARRVAFELITKTPLRFLSSKIYA